MKYLPKSGEFEAFLERLNGALVPEFYEDPPPRSDYTTIQVVGLPRSGTTLLVQLLAKTGLLGYPSNIMALFWRVPAVGARIQRHLCATSDQVSLESAGGRTPEPLDPHEFGYFWRNALGHVRNEMQSSKDAVPAPELQRTLDQVNAVFGAPTVYKNFLVPMHMDYFSTQLRSQRFVMVRRPDIHVAASLIAARRQFGVADDDWFGPIPIDALPAYESPVHRVAHQVRSLQCSLISSRISEHASTCALDYVDICRDPRSAAARVASHAGVDASEEALRRLPAWIQPQDPLTKITDRERRTLFELIPHAEL